MDVRYINPLIVSMSKIFTELTGINIIRDKLFIRKDPIFLDNVAIMIGVTGEIRGQLAISMEKSTALNVASKMMMGMSVSEFDEMAKSAIGEMGNMIAGTYATGLSNLDKRVDITPPSILSGENINYSSYYGEQLTITFKSDIGDISMDVSIKENN